MRKTVHILFWLVLAFWLASVIAPAIAAISAFTVLPEQKASIATYEAFFGDDTEGMGRMVAGYVTNPVFIVTDWIQWFLAPAAFILALVEWQPLRTSRGAGNWIRLLAILAALVLVVIHNGSMSPQMNRDLTDYREAAAADDAERAQTAYTAFDRNHKMAETLFGIRGLLLIIAVGASAGAVRFEVPSQERQE